MGDRSETAAPRRALALLIVAGLAAGLVAVSRHRPETGGDAAPADPGPETAAEGLTQKPAGADAGAGETDPTRTAAAGSADPEPDAVSTEPDPAVAVEHAAPPDDLAGASDAPTPPVQTAIEPPGFDLVRIAPDGAAVVAGTAAPGSRVTITTDAGTLAEVEADADGNFVAIFAAEPSPEPRALGLTAETADGTRTISKDVVVLLPTPAPAAAPEVVAADPQESPATPPAEVSATAAGDIDTAPGDAGVEVAAAPTESDAAPADVAAELSPRPRIAATAVLRGDDVEVTPAGETGPPRQVTLASITYAEAGAVSLGGFGTAGGRIRAYVDDDLAEETRVGTDGRWTLELDGVSAGRYRLRIDLVTAEGSVESRVETPFQRDFPAAPPPRPGRVAPDGSITVQPGTNLWTIARETYGSGVLYSVIYTANRDLIRDPHLIYPGQVLAMPEAEATE